MDEDGNFKSIHYLNYETLRKSFMRQVCEYLKAYYSDDPAYSNKIKSHIDDLYKKLKDGFYVRAPIMKKKYDGHEEWTEADIVDELAIHNNSTKKYETLLQC